MKTSSWCSPRKWGLFPLLSFSIHLPFLAGYWLASKLAAFWMLVNSQVLIVLLPSLWLPLNPLGGLLFLFSLDYSLTLAPSSFIPAARFGHNVRENFRITSYKYNVYNCMIYKCLIHKGYNLAGLSNENLTTHSKWIQQNHIKRRQKATELTGDKEFWLWKNHNLSGE